MSEEFESLTGKPILGLIKNWNKMEERILEEAGRHQQKSSFENEQIRNIISLAKAAKNEYSTLHFIL